MCLGIFPPELWELILCYLARRSLVRISKVSLCFSQVAQSQVRRRIGYHFSSRTPFTLQMVLSDPATMEKSESLALVLAPTPLEHSILSALYSMPDVPDTLSGYTFLDVRRSLNTGKWDDLYSKIIRFDDFDFLYLLLFDIYKCRPDSMITVGNLCGGRMRLIRLWKKWFAENGAPAEYGSETSKMLFTKLVWAGPNFDVGFLVSATESGPYKQAGSGSSSHIIPRPGADTKFYRVKIEKMLVQDHYLLGLLEDFNPDDR